MRDEDVRFEMRIGVLLVTAAVICAIIALLYLAIFT